MTPTNPNQSAPPLWQLDVCSECSYALEGLPETGNCPECGARFDRNRVILHGLARGLNAGIHNGGWRAFLYCALCNIWWISRLQWAAHYRTFLGIEALITSTLFGMVLLTVLRRWTSRRPGLVTVHMDDVGCWQLDEVRVNASSHISHLAMTAFLCFYPSLYFLFWALVLYLAPNHGPFAEWFLAGAIVVFLLMFGLYWHLRKQSTRAGAGDVRKWGTSRTYRWKHIERFELTAASSGHYRIEMFLKLKNIFSPAKGIDAEVRCSADRAAALRMMIRHWIDLSHVSSSLHATLNPGPTHLETHPH